MAVYSTADQKAPFVSDATESYCIGPAASADSYLNMDALLRTVRESGAQAVHPGYGFLSESSVFGRAVESTDGVTWLGPSSNAIDALGDKIRSKQLAIEAGVNVVPGYEDEIESVEHALQIVHEHIGGYPVLLKAAAGGGGKGMRVCRSDEQVRDNYALAKNEALNFFSDDRLLIEKYVENPHHIEFQVLSAHNNNNSSKDDDDLDVVVFCERECSIQRRHQKIIEESPSPLLHESTRLAMVEQIQSLVRRVGYTSAGTVEWLVDEEQNFYFLEMNTRLQVEHPVTEMISGQRGGGIDLVKGMLWAGAGWGLPDEILQEWKKDDGTTKPYFPYRGYAMEARLYAEDPLRGFLPSTGPLAPYREPQPKETRLRIDSGVAEGHVVTPHYDPMLSKVIAYHPDSRRGVIEELTAAMEEYVVGPSIQHNGRLVIDVLRNEAFGRGDTPTSFLEREYPDGFAGVQLTTNQAHCMAACVALFDDSSKNNNVVSIANGDEVIVRLGGMFGDKAYRVQQQLEDGSVTVATIADDSSSTIQSIQQLERQETDPYLARFTVDGEPAVLQVLSQKTTGEWFVEMFGADTEALVQSPREYKLSQHMLPPKKVDTSDMVLSPMPGVLVSLAVEVRTRKNFASLSFRNSHQLCVLFCCTGGQSCGSRSRVVYCRSHEDAKHYSCSTGRYHRQVPGRGGCLPHG